MKLDNLKQLIKEELSRALDKNNLFNSLKVGETVKYMGEDHKVISKNESIVTLERNKTGKKFNLNSNQVKEKVYRSEDYMNENNSSEFNYKKAIQSKMDEPSFLKDLELGAKYKIKYTARDNYGDKELGTTTISITPESFKRYNSNPNTSLENYITNYISTDPKTGQYTDTGYNVIKINSVIKL